MSQSKPTQNEDFDIALIGLMPVGLPGYTEGPGYEKINCECGIECWIGPKQREMAAKTKARKLCPMCVARVVKTDDECVPHSLNPNSGSHSDESKFDEAIKWMKRIDSTRN